MPAPLPARTTGEERQDGRSPSGAGVSAPLVAGAVLVLAGAGAVALLLSGRTVDGGQADDIRRVLDTVTALCGVAVYVLCRATWRQIGDRAAVWAGAGSLFVAVAAATRPDLVGAVLGRHGPADTVLVAVSTAATAVVPAPTNGSSTTSST
jgi:hypothetical protein